MRKGGGGMRGKSRNLLKQIAQNKASYLFLLPFMIVFVLFLVIPAMIALVLSFTQYNILEMPKFVGFRNYIEMLVSDDLFITAVKNTLFFAIITGPCGYIIAYLFAYLINQISDRFRSIFVTVFYIPSLTSGVAMAVVWKVFFANDSYGYLNSFLFKLGLIQEPLQWLSDTRLIIGVVIAISLWMSLGTGFLSFLAGFQTINKELLEAGKMDGINSRTMELWYIILPSMKPQLLFGAVLTVVGSFRVGDMITALVGFPTPNDVGLTIVLHLRDFGLLRYELGYACAISIVLFIMIFGISRLFFKLFEERE